MTRKSRIKLVIAFILLATLGPFVFAIVKFSVLLSLGHYTSIRSQSPFEEAHKRAVTTFVESAGFGISRIRHKKYWNEREVIFEDTACYSGPISLIGLAPEYGDRYFENGPPRKRNLSTAKHRPLSAEEADAIATLRRDRPPWVKFSSSADDVESGIIHVVAPIYAEESCLKCHEVKTGTLLGAFDYVLYRPNDEPAGPPYDDPPMIKP